jgi:biuret amidohydrolase
VAQTAPLADFVLALILPLPNKKIAGIGMPNVTVQAEPAQLCVELDRAALLIIDVQRDFREAGASVKRLATTFRGCSGGGEAVLGAARDLGLLVIHTREGHRPDLSDASPLT